MAPRYVIRVEGSLNQAARAAFLGLHVVEGAQQTTVTGELDQAALHGVLERVRVLGLTLIDVRRLHGGPTRRH
jgi:hypothetical protein